MGDLILGGGGTVAVDNPSVVVEIAQPGYVRGVYLMTGPPGPGGGGSPRPLVRSATTPSDSYVGVANPGTDDDEAGWTVRRLSLLDFTTTTATGAWDDRASLSYS